MLQRAFQNTDRAFKSVICNPAFNKPDRTGILDGKIICECTAALDPMLNINTTLLINDKSVYILAVRTVDGYQNKGYFRELFKYMINDLKNRGYEYATIGVDKNDEKVKSIYKKYGFTEFLKESIEFFPNGEEINLEYYRKKLK